VKRGGGIAAVEDPTTAVFPSMPYNTIARVEVDHILPLPQIAGLVSELAIKELIAIGKEEPMERRASALTCPECRGNQALEGSLIAFESNTYSTNKANGLCTSSSPGSSTIGLASEVGSILFVIRRLTLHCGPHSRPLIVRARVDRWTVRASSHSR
jgi:hypothetical protein